MSSLKPVDMTELDITIRNSLRAKMYNARPAPGVREAILRRAAEPRRGLWFPSFAPATGANLLWHAPRPTPELSLMVPLLYRLLGFPRQIL